MKNLDNQPKPSARVGRFTSSEIGALMKNDRSKTNPGPGEPFFTLVEEVVYERRLKRTLDCESNARPLAWGKLVEAVAFNKLGTEYRLCSQDVLIHPDPEFAEWWAGTPDLEKFDEDKTVADIKCPITLKSFCTFYECHTGEELRAANKDGEKYYWQLVSNAILTGSKYAELIVYCPYYYELSEIRESANNYDGDQNKIAFINWATDADLPFLIEESGYYKNIKTIRFVIPEEDKKALTARVRLAIAEAKRMLTVQKPTIKAPLQEVQKAGENDLKI